MTEEIGLKVTSEADRTVIDNFVAALRTMQSAGGDLATALESTVSPAEDAGRAVEDTGKKIQEAGQKGETGATGLAEVAKQFRDIYEAGKYALATAEKVYSVVIGSYMRAANQIGDIADLTGDSVESISRLSAVFKVTGVDIGNQAFLLRQFNQGLSTMREQLDSGTKLSGPFSEAMAKLGIPLSELQAPTASLGTLFPAIVAGLQSLPAGAERSAAALDILGRGAMELNDVLGMSPERMRAIMNQADRLGTTLSEKDTQAAEDLEQQLYQLQMVGEAMSKSFASVVVPLLGDVAAGFNGIIEAAATSQDTLQSVKDFLDKYGKEHRIKIDINTPPPDVVKQTWDNFTAGLDAFRGGGEVVAATTDILNDRVSRMIDIGNRVPIMQDKIARTLQYFVNYKGDFQQMLDVQQWFAGRLRLYEQMARQYEDFAKGEHVYAEDYINSLHGGAAAAAAAIPPHVDLSTAMAALGMEAGKDAPSVEDFAKAIRDSQAAAEDAKMAYDDAVLSADELGKHWEEAFGKAAEEKVALTTGELHNLAGDLLGVTEKALATGKSLPLSQLVDLATKANNARTYINQLDMDPAVKAALLDILNQAIGKLGEIEAMAGGAAAAMNQIPPAAYTGMGGHEAGAPAVGYQHGGWITEPIVGRGLWTQRRYTLGEGGPEEVRPPGRALTAPPANERPQIIQLVVDGQVLARTVARQAARRM
jgi:hypothetical protein